MYPKPAGWIDGRVMIYVPLSHLKGLASVYSPDLILSAGYFDNSYILLNFGRFVVHTVSKLGSTGLVCLGR